MKVKYEFVTGEVIEVEVSDDIGEVIVELDRVEYNNNHKETRRHRSLSVLGDEGEWLIDPNSEIDVDTLDCPYGISGEKWNCALKELTETQRNAFIAVYRDGYKAREYAEMTGTTEANISKQLSRAKNKIKKVFGNG